PPFPSRFVPSGPWWPRARCRHIRERRGRPPAARPPPRPPPRRRCAPGGQDPPPEKLAQSCTHADSDAARHPRPPARRARGARGREAEGLREQAADPNLWGDQERAQAVTRRLSYLEGELGRLDQLRRRLDDARVGFELADSEGDESMREEAARELSALRKEI